MNFISCLDPRPPTAIIYLETQILICELISLENLCLQIYDMLSGDQAKLPRKGKVIAAKRHLMKANLHNKQWWPFIGKAV